MLFKQTILAGALLVSSFSIALADDDSYGPINDTTTQKECSACHMAFQPQMLPARSWSKIMQTLGNHFGEDASLDKATQDHIEKYLVENAADAGWMSGKFMRGIADGDTPMRITELPYWQRKHNREVPARAWNDPRVKSKANCQACHKYAARGYYDDD